MIRFHDASLHKGRTKTKLIERDFPRHVEMIGRSLEFNLLRLGKSRSCPLWVKSGHVQRTGRCPLSAKSGHQLRNDHRLGRASLMADFVAPLPSQRSPFSSSKPKQLG